MQPLITKPTAVRVEEGASERTALEKKEEAMEQKPSASTEYGRALKHLQERAEKRLNLGLSFAWHFFSREGLAAVLGVPETTIISWEEGTAERLPSEQQSVKIARYYQGSPAGLLSVVKKVALEQRGRISAGESSLEQKDAYSFSEKFIAKISQKRSIEKLAFLLKDLRVYVLRVNESSMAQRCGIPLEEYRALETLSKKLTKIPPIEHLNEILSSAKVSKESSLLVTQAHNEATAFLHEKNNRKKQTLNEKKEVTPLPSSSQPTSGNDTEKVVTLAQSAVGDITSTGEKEKQEKDQVSSVSSEEFFFEELVSPVTCLFHLYQREKFKQVAQGLRELSIVTESSIDHVHHDKLTMGSALSALSALCALYQNSSTTRKIASIFLKTHDNSYEPSQDSPVLPVLKTPSKVLSHSAAEALGEYITECVQKKRNGSSPLLGHSPGETIVEGVKVSRGEFVAWLKGDGYALPQLHHIFQLAVHFKKPVSEVIILALQARLERVAQLKDSFSLSNVKDTFSTVDELRILFDRLIQLSISPHFPQLVAQLREKLGRASGKERERVPYLVEATCLIGAHCCLKGDHEKVESVLDAYCRSIRPVIDPNSGNGEVGSLLEEELLISFSSLKVPLSRMPGKERARLLQLLFKEHQELFSQKVELVYLSLCLAALKEDRENSAEYLPILHTLCGKLVRKIDALSTGEVEAILQIPPTFSFPHPEIAQALASTLAERSTEFSLHSLLKGTASTVEQGIVSLPLCSLLAQRMEKARLCEFTQEHASLLKLLKNHASPEVVRLRTQLGLILLREESLSLKELTSLVVIALEQKIFPEALLKKVYTKAWNSSFVSEEEIRHVVNLFRRYSSFFTFSRLGIDVNSSNLSLINPTSSHRQILLTLLLEELKRSGTLPEVPNHLITELRPATLLEFLASSEKRPSGSENVFVVRLAKVAVENAHPKELINFIIQLSKKKIKDYQLYSTALTKLYSSQISIAENDLFFLCFALSSVSVYHQYFYDRAAEAVISYGRRYKREHPELMLGRYAGMLFSFGRVRQYHERLEKLSLGCIENEEIQLPYKQALQLAFGLTMLDLPLPSLLQRQIGELTGLEAKFFAYNTIRAMARLTSTSLHPTLERLIDEFVLRQTSEVSTFEHVVARHLSNLQIPFETQVFIDGYSIDFEIMRGTEKIALDCDGDEYHYVNGNQDIGLDGWGYLRKSYLELKGYEVIALGAKELGGAPDKEKYLKAKLKW